MIRAENGAERVENWVSGSEAVSGHSRNRLNGSRAWSGIEAAGSDSGLIGRSKSAHI